MKESYKYILFVLGILLISFILWYFSTIVVYFIVSSILAIVGYPVVEFLGKIHIGKYKLPISLRALITLILIWVIFVGFFRIFIPVVVREAGDLSEISVDSVINKITEPVSKFETIYNRFNPAVNISFQEALRARIENVLNSSIFTSFYEHLVGVLGNLFIALFSISFITFFLLKDPHMLSDALVLLVYERHEQAVRHAFKSIRRLLTRYFIGVAGQLTEIFILVTIGMNLVGVNFKESILIGLTAAILNIVPYLGPLIGSSLGVLMAVAFNTDMEINSLILMILYIILVFIIVHLIDNFLYQPFVFSSSVNAHPLEIFIVILMAGSMAGVTGMILAIPTYTIIRVFAKEFFNNFRVVEKLTKKIKD